MDILVVGGGGREHAVIKALKKSPRAGKIYCLPGNGGIAADAECYPIKATDIDGIVDFAKTRGVDFAVVTPDDPLVMGAVDALEAAGVKCFGPNRDAAMIEGSKVFSKRLMTKYGIPTAKSETFDDAERALAYLKGADYPAVIKADGLALGKGAVIVNDFSEAEAAIKDIMVDKIFGESGSKVLVEEFLTGPEVSVLSFTDGKTLVPMISSMDHKRALDGDKGLNTGGMGTVAPNPYYTPEIADRCMREIFLPTIEAMNAEGRTFKGCLYFGLMLTPDGPKVIEYNCRFGDPETQVVLPLLDSDLLEIMLATRNGTLKDADVRFSADSACCVVVASSGYPKKYATGFEMNIPAPKKDEDIYVAGAKVADGKLVTAGGRVLGAVARAKDLRTAIARAYALAKQVKFEGSYMRGDIGARALAALGDK